MRVAYFGNFDPVHSTENEVRKALGYVGADVVCLQENDPTVFRRLGAVVGDFDLVLWTRTGWQPPVPHDDQRSMLAAAESAGVPTVGFHLDRWWGLGREAQVASEPFFRCSLVITADGGHDDEFAAAGVNHRWMPPGVSADECHPGRPTDEFRSDLAFVGSWRPGYHEEWTHRPALIRWLRDTYGDRVKFWPVEGQPAIRGAALRDLYASTKVLIGDSCLAGGATRYWSDRIPETLGRGGFLLHPEVEGLDEHFTPGQHLDTWPLFDWDALAAKIDHYLTQDEERSAIAAQGRSHVLEHHTYTVRARQILDLL